MTKLGALVIGAALIALPDAGFAQVFAGAGQGLGPNTAGLTCSILGAKASAFPATVFDATSHERVTIATDECPAGYIKAVNTATGQRWNVDFAASGAMSGKDEQGSSWTYSPTTRLFKNVSTGRSCKTSNPRFVCE